MLPALDRDPFSGAPLRQVEDGLAQGERRQGVVVVFGTPRVLIVRRGLDGHDLEAGRDEEEPDAVLRDAEGRGVEPPDLRLVAALRLEQLVPPCRGRSAFPSSPTSSRARFPAGTASA